MIKPKVDITGMKFGRLTVVKQVEDHIFPSGNKTSMWLCRCDCGKEVNVSMGHLKSGHTTSCGCIHVKDLAGQKFGMLTVIERAEDAKTISGLNQVRWKCLCECGNTTIVRACNLKSGGTISCGCYRKLNDFVEHDNYIEFFTSKGESFYVDKEDFEKVHSSCWFNNGNGYLRANTPDGTIYLHRLVTNCPAELIPDHIGGHDTRNDNRKDNLRLGTRGQNMQNAPLRSNNKSGCTGVHWDNERQKWQAQIKIDNKTRFLGRFESYDDAVAARRAAEEKYFGEWSYDNSQKRTRERIDQ